tara:strand:+ start:1085 stop:1465 length:381 start_codon:yes stop_codon:yes gene_type:complete
VAHYARVNSDNIVTYVTPIPNSMITDENGTEHEDRAIDHLNATVPTSDGDRWIQTSYNNNFRVRYAGLGYTWDEERNAFIEPKPFESWTFNTGTLSWDPPVPMPEVTDGTVGYVWDEDIVNWRSVY